MPLSGTGPGEARGKGGRSSDANSESESNARARHEADSARSARRDPGGAGRARQAPGPAGTRRRWQAQAAVSLTLVAVMALPAAAATASGAMCGPAAGLSGCLATMYPRLRSPASAAQMEDSDGGGHWQSRRQLKLGPLIMTRTPPRGGSPAATATDWHQSALGTLERPGPPGRGALNAIGVPVGTGTALHGTATRRPVLALRAALRHSQLAP